MDTETNKRQNYKSNGEGKGRRIDKGIQRKDIKADKEDKKARRWLGRKTKGKTCRDIDPIL